jgi:hypothetical protein
MGGATSCPSGTRAHWLPVFSRRARLLGDHSISTRLQDRFRIGNSVFCGLRGLAAPCCCPVTPRRPRPMSARPKCRPRSAQWISRETWSHCFASWINQMHMRRSGGAPAARPAERQIHRQVCPHRISKAPLFQIRSRNRYCARRSHERESVGLGNHRSRTALGRASHESRTMAAGQNTR